MVGAIRGPMLDHELDHFLVIIKDEVCQSFYVYVYVLGYRYYGRFEIQIK